MRTFRQYISLQEAVPEESIPLADDPTQRPRTVRLDRDFDNLLAILMKQPDLKIKNRPQALKFIYNAIQDRDGNKLEELLRMIGRNDLVKKLSGAEHLKIDDVTRGKLEKLGINPLDVLGDWANAFYSQDPQAIQGIFDYMYEKLNVQHNPAVVQQILHTFSDFVESRKTNLAAHLRRWLASRGGEHTQMDAETWDAFAKVLESLPSGQQAKALDIMLQRDPGFLDQLKALWHAQGRKIPETPEEEEALKSQVRKTLDTAMEFWQEEIQRLRGERPMSRRTFLGAFGGAALTGSMLTYLLMHVGNQRAIEQAVKDAAAKATVEAGQHTIPIGDGQKATFRAQRNQQGNYDIVVDIDLPPQGKKPYAGEVLPKIERLMAQVSQRYKLPIGRPQEIKGVHKDEPISFTYKNVPFNPYMFQGFKFLEKHAVTENLTFSEWFRF